MTKRIRRLDKRHRWVLDWQVIDTGWSGWAVSHSTNLYTFWRCRVCGVTS